MNTKFLTGLFALLATALIVVVIYQARNITDMQQQIDAISAQVKASPAASTATAPPELRMAMAPDVGAVPAEPATSPRSNTPVEPDVGAAPVEPVTSPWSSTPVEPDVGAAPVEPATSPWSSTPVEPDVGAAPVESVTSPKITTPVEPETTPVEPQPDPVDPQAVDNFGPHPGFDPYRFRDIDPYLEIERMQREMDRIIDETFGRYGIDPYYGPGRGPYYSPGPGFGQHPGSAPRPGFRRPMHDITSPEMDLRDTGDEYVVLVDLPGSDEKSLSVRLEGDVLNISAKQSYDKKETDSRGNTIYRERRSGSFRRSLTLPGPVKESGMKTEYDNGVLRITIPKA